MNENLSASLGIRLAYSDSYYLSETERRRHIYAIGRTGSGKSTFLRSLALQDIYAGRGCCIIDPHGDNAEALADSIPTWRTKDVVYFDASDREHVIGFNPLEHSGSVDDADLVASETVTLFKGMFRDSWGEWLEYLLKNAALTVLAQKNQPVTLISIMRVLDDKHYRKRFVGRLTDPVVRSFWDKFFENSSDRDERDRISSTINKVGKFALSPVLRNIVGQHRSGFDLKRVMDNKQILIVNLSKGRIGEDNANFLGSAMVSKITSQALRRSAVPEAQRVPFYLNVDEFQNFTSDEFTSVVSEARKYALSLAVAHQNFSQLSERLLNQIIKEAGTTVAFKVAFGDDERLASAFHPLNLHELSSTSDGEFYVKSGVGNPTRVRGYAPHELDVFRTGSLDTIRTESRRRYSRRRGDVEEKFGAWYSKSEEKPKRKSGGGAEKKQTSKKSVKGWLATTSLVH